MLVCVPVSGMLSDRLGRKRLMLGGIGAVALLTYPSPAALTKSPSMWSLILFQCGFALLIGITTGIVPAATAEVCPARVRSTGISIAYGFAVALFGGLAPLVAVRLVKATGSPMVAPAFYIVASCVLSGAMTSVLSDERRRALAARATYFVRLIPAISMTLPQTDSTASPGDAYAKNVQDLRNMTPYALITSAGPAYIGAASRSERS